MNNVLKFKIWRIIYGVVDDKIVSIEKWSGNKHKETLKTLLEHVHNVQSVRDRYGLREKKSSTNMENLEEKKMQIVESHITT